MASAMVDLHLLLRQGMMRPAEPIKAIHTRGSRSSSQPRDPEYGRARTMYLQ
jgi:hypothetical protein